jgi:sigma-B regulation protein RsbU (phosphoserine phosphatase)
MQLLNWVVCTSRFNDRYATALCFTFNSDDLSLKYINAAFNPLILYEIHSDSFLELDTKGIPIGIERDFIYESKEYRAHGPCIGCIYSNGIADAVNAQGQPYSIGRIKDLIRLHNSETPALIIRRISSDLNDFISNTVLKEDISIVIFRIE